MVSWGFRDVLIGGKKEKKKTISGFEEPSSQVDDALALGEIVTSSLLKFKLLQKHLRSQGSS